MKRNLLFNQVTAIGKRFAMVLTMLLIVGIGQVWGATTTYTFTSNKWADSSNGWTSGKDGVAYLNSGVQVTKNGTGAYATSKTSFTNISKIDVKYCTNGSSGAGTIVLTVGSTSKTLTISKNSGTTMRTISASFDPNVSGTIKITVNCTTNSIYIGGITITTVENAKPHTVTLDAGPGSCAESVTESSAGAGVTLLTPTLDCGDWEFAGWTTSAVATETSSKPATLLTGTYKPTANTTLYAVYQRTKTTDGGGGGNTSVTFTDEDSGGWTTTAGKQNGTKDGVSISTDNGIYSQNNNQLRVYKDATFTVSSENIITSIVFSSSNYDWSNTSGGDYSNKTWTGNTNSVTFTAGNGQVRITQLVVTVSAGGTTSTTYYHSTPECITETTVTLNPNGGSFASTPTGWKQDGDNYTKEVDGSVDLPTPTKTGYKFDGWYDGTTEVSSSYTPSKNVTLTAQWTAKTTNITLNANTNNHGSGSNSSIKATYNQTLPSFTACTPATGYTLNGYFTAETGGTKVIDKDGKLVSDVSGYTSADGKWANESANLTLYAQYVASQYTVTFDANDGTGTMEPQTFEHGVSQSLSANQFTREHYTFAGWNTVEDGSGQSVNDKGEVTVYANITLYAQWTAIKYTITLNAAIDNPVTVPGVTNADGATLTAATPCDACEEEGWIFVGWKEDSPLEETTTEPTNLHEAGVKYHPTRNVNLYPVYSKTDEVFGFTKYEKVTSAPSDWSGKYLISNGTQTATGTQFSKSALAIANFIPGTEEKTEYEFTISKDGNDDNYYILSPDGTYYVGGTTGNNNKADLIFSDNPNEDKYLWILSASDPMTQNKASNRYIGVGTESNTNVFKQYSTSGTNAKCYLYKRIEETYSTTTYNSNPSCVPTHTITWMNGDDVLGQDKVEEGKTPEYAGDEPTKAADAQYTYTFKGWTPNIVEATADATYTATYTATVNKYTITWKNGETTLENDENVPYGTEPSYNGATPTKAATAQYTYTFNSWDPEVTSVTGDAIYTAKFDASINHYTVTFEMNGHGTAPVNQTIAYGSKVSEPSAPTADGYEFAGWYKDEACTEAYDFSSTITGDLPLYAKWLNIYTITWKANGLEYTTTKVTEGNPITSPPSSPDLGDYCGQVFVGWTTAEMEETTNVAPTLYPNPTPFPTATEEAPKTYYAVFADYKN